jgi:hypothetical protein
MPRTIDSRWFLLPFHSRSPMPPPGPCIPLSPGVSPLESAYPVSLTCTTLAGGKPLNQVAEALM